MFLILGTPECRFCLEAKKLLENRGLKFTYVDLTLKYESDWRSIFTTLKTILNGQRTIPIIFEHAEASATVPTDLTVDTLAQHGWKLIGDYFTFEEYVEEDISLDDNY